MFLSISQQTAASVSSLYLCSEANHLIWMKFDVQMRSLIWKIVIGVLYNCAQ